MSFGLGHGRKLDDAPGVIGVAPAEYPPLPDEILTDPLAGRLDSRRWFAHPERSLHVEIGSGKGGFLVQETTARPEVNFLGIEYAREFYAYAADRLRRRQATNVRMLCADATDFLAWRCPAGVVDVIHLYYSDPWPKAKHHKNRVVQHTFLAQVWRVLKPGGELRIVTDHDELWQWCQERMEPWTTPGPVPPALAKLGPVLERERVTLPPAGPIFTPRPFDPPSWADEGEVVGTNYERKFTGGEKKPHAVVLSRVATNTHQT